MTQHYEKVEVLHDIAWPRKQLVPKWIRITYKNGNWQEWKYEDIDTIVIEKEEVD